FLSLTHSPTPQLYTLSLHDALPISSTRQQDCTQDKSTKQLDGRFWRGYSALPYQGIRQQIPELLGEPLSSDHDCSNIISYSVPGDRKSTRLNSSHDQISYAVFCLKK